MQRNTVLKHLIITIRSYYMTKVNERDRKSAAHYAEHQIIRDLLGGTKSMRLAGEKYLPREPAEEAFYYENPENKVKKLVDPYKNRLKRAVLFNAVKRATQNYLGKLFKKTVVIETENKKKEIQAFLKSIDGAGALPQHILSKAAKDVIEKGCGGFMCDAEQDRNNSGYIYWVSPENVLGGKFKGKELVNLRLLEIHEEDVEDSYDTELVEVVREFKKSDGKVSWTLHKKVDGKFVRIQDWVVLNIDVIPYVPVLASGHIAGELFDDSPLLALAEVNVSHWIKSSSLENIIHIAQHPILKVTGLSDSPKNPTIKVGVGNAVALPKGADLSYEEPSCNGVEKAQEEIEKTKQLMEVLGLELVTTKQNETATGRALDADVANSSLTSIANTLSAGFEKAFKIVGNYYYEPELVVSVKISKDYGITASQVELDNLTKARLNEDISHDYYMKELKRRGVVDESLDLEQNKLELQAEREAL
ncbi:DUF4055 domain-containing protein [Vibrio parahaemolyticus]|nr:DUF4055 domain-containing protein [Vibrio parahaemolyticus]